MDEGRGLVFPGLGRGVGGCFLQVPGGAEGENVGDCAGSCLGQTGHSQRVGDCPQTKLIPGLPVVAQWKRIRLGTLRLRVRSLASLSGLSIGHCCELWRRSQMQLRSGIAAALVIQPLAWEPPYATGAALKDKKKKKKKE